MKIRKRMIGMPLPKKYADEKSVDRSNLLWEFTSTPLVVILVAVVTTILGWPLGAVAAVVENNLEDNTTLVNGDLSSIPPPLLDLIHQATPLSPSSGIIRKLVEYSDYDQATIVLCATALQQHGTDYERFIKLMHDELIDENDQEIGSVRGVRPYFLQTKDREDLFSRCLEQNISTSTSETLYRLFQIEWATNIDKTRAYRWLVKLAEDGHFLAKYTLAKEIIFAARDGSGRFGSTTRKYVTVSAENYYRLLRPVAESGNRQAQMDLIYFYLGGHVSPEWDSAANFNVDKALHWLKQLAAQEENIRLHDAAIAMIGSLYYYGTEMLGDYADSNYSFRRHKKNQEYSIRINRRQALKWLQKIPEERLVKSCNAAIELSELYRTGDVVEANPARADNYFRIFAKGCVKP